MEPTNETEIQEAQSSAAVDSAAAVPGAVIRINGGALQTSLNAAEVIKVWPDFSVGDTINVQYKIKEGDKERIQNYEGNVISIRGEGLSKTFIVRRISHDVGVERIFPYHTPAIAGIKVVRKGRVRRGKLFYLRGKSGKGARIKELFTGNVAAKPAAKKVAKKAVKKSAAKKSASKKKSGAKK